LRGSPELSGLCCGFFFCCCLLLTSFHVLMNLRCYSCCSCCWTTSPSPMISSCWTYGDGSLKRQRYSCCLLPAIRRPSCFLPRPF
jgi:hypothetical protein